MAVNDPDTHRTGTRPGSMGRYDPRATGNLTPYLIGAAILFAVIYMFFWSGTTNQATLPTETTVPQTTTTPAPAPATK